MKESERSSRAQIASGSGAMKKGSELESTRWEAVEKETAKAILVRSRCKCGQAQPIEPGLLGTSASPRAELQIL